jgi:hypothetical protein
MCPQGTFSRKLRSVSRLVYGRGHLCFVCEEVLLYTQAGCMPPMFGKLIGTGRHQQIDNAWTAQRAAEVPRTILFRAYCGVPVGCTLEVDSGTPGFFTIKKL